MDKEEMTLDELLGKTFELSETDQKIILRASILLQLYLEESARISDKMWEVVSFSNHVIWREIESQQELLQKWYEQGKIEVEDSI